MAPGRHGRRMSDLLRAAIRAHTEPARWEGPQPSRRRWWVPPGVEDFITYDTETLVDRSQDLLVAAYRVSHLEWLESGPDLSWLEEGLIHPDDLPTTNPDR